jgi:hypothetical protein
MHGRRPSRDRPFVEPRILLLLLIVLLILFLIVILLFILIFLLSLRPPSCRSLSPAIA